MEVLMSETANITYTSSLTDICKINSSFDMGVLRICYTGENKNRTYISKETLEKSIPSIYNCPVVCHYDRETDTLGGHDMEIVSDSDGELKIVNLTTPVGVIPESAKVWFEDYEEDDGTIHEYLYTEALLWKRQEAYKKIKNNGVTGQSMEINIDIKSGKTVDDIYHIENFEFRAFTLVGEEPCFESSSLEVFSCSDFKSQLSEMMNELRETYTKVNIITNNKNPMKGGVETLKNTKIDKTKSSSELKDFTLVSNIGEELIIGLNEVKTKREWGEVPRYSFIDYDLDSKEVYCYDRDDHDILYGFTFSVNGDSVAIDYDSKKRKKYEIVDFEEGDDSPSVIARIVQPMEDKLKDFSKVQADLDEALETIESMTLELDELRKFKSDTEEAIEEGKRDELFSKFEDLTGIEEFEALKEDNSEYNIDALEEKCYAIRGKNSSELKFTKAKTPKLKVSSIDYSGDSNEPYGGLFVKYAKKEK